jgi:lactose/L-arabinose transport system substrate-binding protein
MKRGLILCLTAVLLLVTLQGVFAAGSQEGASGAKKLTVWCWDPNFNGYSMGEAAKVYEAMHPEVTIEIVDIPDNIEGKIEAGLQAGGAGLPDIALFQDFIIEKFIQNYAGSFVDLKAEGIDFNQFAQYKVAPMTDQGKIYGIPFDTGSTGFFLRTDMLKDAGLKPEDYMKAMTWSEVIKLGETVKAKTGKALIAYDNTVFDFLRIMVQSTGTQFFNKDGSVNYNTPATRKSIAYLKEMNDKGILYMSEGWNNWIAAFNNDESVGLMNALWIIGTLKSKPENAGKWMVAPTPLVEGVKGAQNASNNGGSSWYVFKSSKNKDLAVDFLKSTWAGTSPEALGFYNDILKGAGAMGTFLPSRKGSNYTANDEFFYKDQAVYKEFSSWMEKVPTLYYTANYTSMRTALNNAMQLMFSGSITSVDDVIKAAEAEYKQISGN